MQLHNPYAVATPSQRLAAAARSLRRAKIAAQAVNDTPIILRPKLVEVVAEIEPIDPITITDKWVERQKEVYAPKNPWFSIECEIDPLEPVRPRIDEIISATGRYYEVPRVEIISARRTVPIVRARQVVMYLSKRLTLRSLPDIGRRLGDRDHTTVLHAVRKIERLIKTDEKLAFEVAAISASLEAA